MERLSQLLGRLSATMGGASIQALLDGAARGSVELLPIDGAGVVLLPSEGTADHLAASDPAALRFEQLQSSLMQGPCFAAHRAMTAHSVPDLALSEGFPEFAAAARYLGQSSVFAFPLRRDGVSLGALDLYRMSPGSLGAAETRAAQGLADFLGGHIAEVRARTVLDAATTLGDGDGELVRALHAERAFVATLVHELGSSLASIAGFTWLLEHSEEHLSQRQRQSVRAIHRNSDDLRTLTADLLTLLSLDLGVARGSGNLDRVDLRTVVTSTRDSLMISPSGGPALTFQLCGRTVPVQGEVKQLERMLANLLSNAIKYTPSSGTVSCVLSRRGGYATIEVRDTGIGVRDEEQAELFTRFFRASSAKERGIEGTGLGLAIVQAVVQSHAGTVSVSSVLGAGTCVVVRLPIAVDERAT